MSYDIAELEKKALAAIKKHKLKFVTHVVAYLPCSERTFFNQQMHNLQSIKSAVEENRTNAKVKTLNRWEQSDNPTLQVAFMKLIADDDEADRLNGSKQKHELTGADGQPIQSNQTLTINIVKSKEIVRNDD